VEQALRDELAQAMSDAAGLAYRQVKLAEVFAQFDLDGGGSIDSTELMQLGEARRELGQKDDEWTEERNAKLVESLDSDGDGRVSCTEFVEHFERGMPKAQDEFGAVVEEFLAAARECRESKCKEQQAGLQEQLTAAAAVEAELRAQLAKLSEQPVSGSTTIDLDETSALLLAQEELQAAHDTIAQLRTKELMNPSGSIVDLESGEVLDLAIGDEDSSTKSPLQLAARAWQITNEFRQQGKAFFFEQKFGLAQGMWLYVLALHLLVYYSLHSCTPCLSNAVRRI